MQIEALKIFCDAVGYSSFSRSAEENGITQSAASQIISRLEKHLEVKLIDRSHRPWRLTDEGKVAFERSREVLEAFYRLENDVHKRVEHHRREVRAATIYSIGLVYMGGCQEAFEALSLPVRLHMEYLHPEEVLRRVLSDEIDLGVMAFAPSRRELTRIPLCEEEVVVAVAPGHPLAAAGTVRMEQLDRIRIVGFDANITMGRKVSQFLHAHGLRVDVTATFDNVEAIKRAVEESRSAALLPATTLRREVETGSLVCLPIVDARMTRPLMLIHRRGRSLTPAMEAFIECMKEETRSGKYELQVTAWG